MKRFLIMSLENEQVLLFEHYRGDADCHQDIPQWADKHSVYALSTESQRKEWNHKLTQFVNS
ncbi:hypothetical protein BH10BAC3_BH10BAC3_33570 [soil metagenome]